LRENSETSNGTCPLVSRYKRGETRRGKTSSEGTMRGRHPQDEEKVHETGWKKKPRGGKDSQISGGAGIDVGKASKRDRDRGLMPTEGHPLHWQRCEGKLGKLGGGTLPPWRGKWHQARGGPTLNCVKLLHPFPIMCREPARLERKRTSRTK